MFHSIGDSVISSPLSVLNFFTFIKILGGTYLVQRIMHESSLYPILPQHSQITIYLTHRAAMIFWRGYVPFLVEDDEPKG